MGIEPTCSAWKADVLPLNYTRCVLSHPSTNHFISLQIKKLVLYLYRRYFFTNSYAMSELVEGVGFEPTKAEPTDLQSAPVDRLGTPPKFKPAILKESNTAVNTCIYLILTSADDISGSTIPDLTGLQLLTDSRRDYIVHFTSKKGPYSLSSLCGFSPLGISTG